MGFPPRSWFGYRTMGMHAFPVLYRGDDHGRPDYFEDFWTQPGYLGHASPPSLQRDIVQHRCEVVATITDQEAAELGLGSGSSRVRPRSASIPPGAALAFPRRSPSRSVSRPHQESRPWAPS